VLLLRSHQQPEINKMVWGRAKSVGEAPLTIAHRRVARDGGRVSACAKTDLLVLPLARGVQTKKSENRESGGWAKMPECHTAL
jgi:hypothetical protein